MMWRRWIPPSLHPGHVLCAALVVAGACAPAAIAEALSAATQWFTHAFGWLVMLACTALVVLCAVLALGRSATLVLGMAGEAPEYSTRSWLGMLFAAGIGSGLVFYGTAEPLIHYMQPPPSLSASLEEAARARRALSLTYFHWGIHAWAIYAVAALAVAFTSFRLGRPMLPSQCVTRHAALGRAVDSLAILSVVFGIVGTLSQGVLQLSDATARVSGAPAEDPLTLRLAWIAGLSAAFIASAASGIGRGIKRLSDLNMLLAILLMGFVLLASDSVALLNGTVSALGDYLDHFARDSLNMRPFADDKGWMANWTVTLFLWWVAWAPFVGVFIARISRGRTVKEFMLGVLLAPTGFCLLWFGIFGSAGLQAELSGSDAGLGAMALEAPQRTLFALLETLPYAQLTSLLSIALIFTFLVTSADSGTYVLGMFTRGGMVHPPVAERLFWGMVLALVSIWAILHGGDTAFFRSIAIFGAIPYLFVLLWQAVCLWREAQKACREP